MDDVSFPLIHKLVSSKTGLRLPAHDNGMLRKIVAGRMEFHRLSSIREYINLLEQNTDKSHIEREELTVLLTVGESYFFRDKGQFQLIKERILPQLFERRKAERTVRIWSAGCSTGEEPYSLAILLSEMGAELADWQIHLIGTDIKEEFLQKARSGTYTAWSFRTLPNETREKYFTHHDGLFKLDSRIRKMVTFRRQNLTTGTLPDSKEELRDMDLILCRNVFIYYKREEVAAIVEKMAGALREGGYLITGHGELFSVTTGLLKPRMYAESLVYERVAKASERPRDLFNPIALAPVFAPEIRTVPAVVSPQTASAAKKPDWPGAIGAAETCLKNGNSREAIGILKSLPGEIRHDFRPLLLLGSAHANLGEYDHAVEYLHKAVKAKRLSPEPYYMLAHIAEENGNIDEAKENLRKVIYLEPSSVPAYLELAAIHENEGDFEKTRKLRKSALDFLKTVPKESVVTSYGEPAEKLIKQLQKLLK